MKTHRPLRVAEVIRDELAKLILREVEFEGAIVTITEAKVMNSMDWADIFVSVLPSERANDALHKLYDATNYLHHLLNKKMNIRPMPRIRFKLDHGPEKAAAIEKVFLEEAPTPQSESELRPKRRS
jgi:ribosome-binding factor A